MLSTRVLHDIIHHQRNCLKRQDTSKIYWIYIVFNTLFDEEWKPFHFGCNSQFILFITVHFMRIQESTRNSSNL